MLGDKVQERNSKHHMDFLTFSPFDLFKNETFSKFRQKLMKCIIEKIIKVASPLKYLIGNKFEEQ